MGRLIWLAEASLLPRLLAQAGQHAIDELVLSSFERQRLLAVHQVVNDLFQIHCVAYI
jgi:hypothetical protein